MFIRTKKIKNKNYAYLVRNKWTKRGVRQKTVRYLGRLYDFKDEIKDKGIEFFDFIKNDYNKNFNDFNEYTSNKYYYEIIKDLIKFELIKNDFNENKKIKNLLYNKKIKNLIININKKNIFNKKIVLKTNEGFLCNHTIKKLYNFKKTEDKETDMYNFAEIFVNAGIKAPKEVFVDLFEKVTTR